MRTAFSIIFISLIVAMILCSVSAYRSNRPIANAVSMLNYSLIPPLFGNLVIMGADELWSADLGRYIYILGMNVVMYALLKFTIEYCRIGEQRQRWCRIAYGFLAADTVQLLLNPLFHHAFRSEPVPVEGWIYFQIVPCPGIGFHRFVDYGIMAVVIIIFIVMTVKTPRLNRERYLAVLAIMIITTGFETFYIFSRSPVDRSMLGFGMFGILIYYFSILYRPMRLLDRMLATIASTLPEALFFFDNSDRCIWANAPGIALAGIEDDMYEGSHAVLERLFGPIMEQADGWSTRVDVKEADGARSYIIEKHAVTDDRSRLVGWFLNIRDNTTEHRQLLSEMYKATHDSLTGLHNREGYELLMVDAELATTFLLMVDVDKFKDFNDTYGHDVGDQVLKKTARVLKQNFRSNDQACRIGGDEFIMIIGRAMEDQRYLITSRLERISEELADTSDGLPPISVSVGIAHGSYVQTPEELFKCADKALYETKRHGRKGFTFYDPAVDGGTHETFCQ